MVALGFIIVLILVRDLRGADHQAASARPRRTSRRRRRSTTSASRRARAREHLFGVDPIGRDVFSRVLYGAQVSLKVAFIGTGLSRAHRHHLRHHRRLLPRLGRHRDRALARRAARVPGAAARPRPRHRVLRPERLRRAGSSSQACRSSSSSSSLANSPYVARIIRGQVLSLREKEFVEASRSLGASNWRIMFREILPNLVAPIIVYATLFIPANILLEAALSFLGVGVQPPDASGARCSRRRRRSSTWPGGSCSSRAWRCCSPCWPSTWSATACRTRSTRRARSST